MRRRFTLTTRLGGQVEHEHFDTLPEAIDALERNGHRLQGKADAESVGGSLMRRYEPQDQVTARLEVSGRKVRVGVDVRGDGRAVPFSGRISRGEIERESGESAYDALRRVTSD
jgi:predicted ArsR family transcriptional regulator